MCAACKFYDPGAGLEVAHWGRCADVTKAIYRADGTPQLKPLVFANHWCHAFAARGADTPHAAIATVTSELYGLYGSAPYCPVCDGTLREGAPHYAVHALACAHYKPATAAQTAAARSSPARHVPADQPIGDLIVGSCHPLAGTPGFIVDPGIDAMYDELASKPVPTEPVLRQTDPPETPRNVVYFGDYARLRAAKE